MISELITGICIGIAIGLAFGILTVYTWHSNNYNATRYQFMRCALRERISSLEMELSMRKFENEHLYKKILERDDKKMIEERFIVKEKKGVPLMYDNKTGGWYTHLLAHRSVLEEFCRIANNLNRKSKCCQNKMELMMKFVDVDAMNEYLEETGQKGCD